MKRKKSKGDSKETASESTPLTPRREAAEMTLTGETTASTKESVNNSPQSSDHSITTNDL